MKIALRYSACFLLIISSWANAQKLRFDNYSLDHGLSQSTIVSMLQDRQGFIWIGTEDGLNRFDGYSFKIYRKTKADSSNTIGGNFVWDILEASNGNLWIAHEGGITRFDPVHESFKVYKVGHGSVNVKSLHQTDSTGLWIGTSDQGLFYLDFNTGKLTQYINTNASLLKYNNILDIVSYSKDDLVIATRGAGIFLFNRKQSFRRPILKNIKDSTLLSGNDIWKILRHKDQYWLGTLHGIIKLDMNLQPLDHYPLPHGTLMEQRVSTILFDKNDMLWVACYGGGLARFDPKTATYTFANHSPTDPHALANDLVFSLLLDRSENLWVGTWIAGISKLRKGYNNFQNYSNEDIGTPSDFITSITSLPCGQKETLLLGVYGGGIRQASLQYGQTLAFSQYHFNSPAIDQVAETANCFFKGRDTFWIGSDTDGLIGVPVQDIGCNTKPGAVIHYTSGATPQSLSGNAVKTILEDHEGNLWVGTIGNGLNKITHGASSTPVVIRYIKNEKDPSAISHNRVNHIIQDKDKNIWIATSDGINLYTEKGFDHFLKGKVITLLQSKNGTLYAGTEQGLFQANPKPPYSFAHIPALGEQLINALREDNTGKLWITTNQGMFWYDPSGAAAMQFRSSDGLQGDEYNFNAAAKTGQGLLAFGGVNGLTLFDPQKVILNTSKPPVVISSLKIANQEVPVANAVNTEGYTLPQNINHTANLTLRHNQNYLTFNFVALDYTNPAKNKYAYKLEGIDKDWVYADALNRSATYTNLTPGAYTLRIKAANNDNLWNAEGTTMAITILPPWWRTWWAYAIYILAAVVALVLARRNIIQRERLKTELQLEHVELTKLKELDDFKSRFFANISHEFRTPLSLIIGPTEKLLAEDKEKSYPELNIIHNNSISLLNLVNQMLDLSRVEAGSLQLQVRKTDLTTGLKIFTSPFYSLAASKRIELSVVVPSTPIDGYADLSFLEKIVNNLLSNAIKYTQASGVITFKAEDKNGYLQITVTDTGMGIPDSQIDKIFDRFYRVHEVTSVEGTGLGLALTRELVKTHRGEITVTSEYGKGSTFIVTLPIAEQYYSADEYRTESPGYLPLREPLPDATPPIVVDINASPDGAEKPVLLVIEDNTELREFIKSTLINAYTILEAPDGETGLRLAIEYVPDIIITDWMMPIMDGATVCRNIKSTTATDHIPIILLTAKAGVESRIEGLETGADDYLTKPFDLRELRIRVANLIEQRKKLQAKYQVGTAFAYKPVKAESANEKFLKRLHEIVEERISDSKFGVEELAREIGMSRVQLYRKLTALTNQSAVEFLRSYRLERAADLLRQGVGNIAEIAFQVGFDNPSYFTKTFREHFGKLPSELTKT